MTFPDLPSITEPFVEFPKMSRLYRDIIITEKIDGTNAQIYFTDAGEMFVGSRTRWINPLQDNHGFAKWAYENEEELRLLGPGRHFGEWWGSGINRGYGMAKGEKKFSLFNVTRYTLDPEIVTPACCSVVPILYRGIFSEEAIKLALERLEKFGSVAKEGFMDPEGVVVFHTHSGQCFKRTLKNDEVPKSLVGKA